MYASLIYKMAVEAAYAFGQGVAGRCAVQTGLVVGNDDVCGVTELVHLA